MTDSILRQLFRTEFHQTTVTFIDAANAGICPLPDATRTALDHLDRLEAALANHKTADVNAARAVYAERVADAIRTGVPVPGGEDVVQVARTARLHEEQRLALEAARTLLMADLRVSIPVPDAMVTEYLRPAVEAVYAEARAQLDRHGPLLTGPAEGAVTAPAAVGEAWTRFGELAARHSDLRRLHDRLTRDDVRRDVDGRFAVTRDDPRDEKLWGQQWGVRGTWRPWPTDPRGYLGWLLTSGVTPWVPTAAERDERHAEVFPPIRLVGTVGGGMVHASHAAPVGTS